MKTSPKIKSSDNSLRPALTPEARENQLISLAYDLAEKHLREGTATSQEITWFLKLGSSREKLEQARLAHENELTEAKKEALKSSEHSEELYENAIKAMRIYTGQESDSEEGDPDDGNPEY